MASVCPRDCHPNVDYSICTVHTLHHMHTSNWHFFNFLLNFINSMPLNSHLIFLPALSFSQSDLFRSLDILFLVLTQAIADLLRKTRNVYFLKILFGPLSDFCDIFWTTRKTWLLTFHGGWRILDHYNTKFIPLQKLSNRYQSQIR